MHWRPFRSKHGIAIGVAWSMLAACRAPARDDDAPTAVAIATVRERCGAGECGLARERASELLQRAFSSSESFRVLRPSSGEQALAASAWYGVRRTPEGVEVLFVHLSMAAPEALAARVGNPIDNTIRFERQDGRIDLERDLDAAFRRAVGVLEAKLMLAKGEAEDVAALLASSDAELVLLAVDWVRDNAAERWAESVVALLDHPNDDVGLAAVECLGVIGRPEHAGAVVRTARLADRAHAHRVYEALASLGGPQARGFLEFAARNEEDPNMAAVARAALSELERGSHRRQRTPEAVPRGHRQ